MATEYQPTNPEYYITMHFSNTATLALALLLGTAIAAPVAADSEGAHLNYIYTQKKDAAKRADALAGDVHLNYIYTQKKEEKRDEPLHPNYIYTQKKDQKRDEPLHPNYIYTQKKDQKRDEPLHPNYIYTQKKDQKRGETDGLVDVLAVEGGPRN
ncbi:hypothetical protein SLS58_002811 [Diplodia intermedia]|uniref:Uncharacterized protein n=1 Tax=Diplodia intermedia TaxID=856260 RepID=A0ABR3TYL8_9PEZI